MSDLPKLSAQTRTLIANVAAWSVKEQAYVAQQRAAKKQPDMKTLVNYQHQIRER